MNKCFINQCPYNDRREFNNCLKYNNVITCNNYLVNNTIQLKPITNETFNNYNDFNQKLKEELAEFNNSILGYGLSKKHFIERDFQINFWKDNIIEEFYDVIQSMLQLMIFEGLTLEEIIQGQEKHFEKLEKRGWKFNEDDNIY